MTADATLTTTAKLVKCDGTGNTCIEKGVLWNEPT